MAFVILKFVLALPGVRHSVPAPIKQQCYWVGLWSLTADELAFFFRVHYSLVYLWIWSGCEFVEIDHLSNLRDFFHRIAHLSWAASCNVSRGGCAAWSSSDSSASVCFVGSSNILAHPYIGRCWPSRTCQTSKSCLASLPLLISQQLFGLVEIWYITTVWWFRFPLSYALWKFFLV